MRISYDEKADAMYIYWTEKPVDKTAEISNRVKVDLDNEDNLRGIEILFVSKALKDTDFLNLEFQLPKIGKVSIELPAPQEAN